MPSDLHTSCHDLIVSLALATKLTCDTPVAYTLRCFLIHCYHTNGVLSNYLFALPSAEIIFFSSISRADEGSHYELQLANQIRLRVPNPLHDHCQHWPLWWLGPESTAAVANSIFSSIEHPQVISSNTIALANHDDRARVIKALLVLGRTPTKLPSSSFIAYSSTCSHRYVSTDL
jgi:hypothetical protein